MRVKTQTILKIFKVVLRKKKKKKMGNNISNEKDFLNDLKHERTPSTFHSTTTSVT